MPTNYIKNFNKDDFKQLYEKLMTSRTNQTPLWNGTIYIGTQPLYVECHVKWLADKIEDYFFKTIPGVRINGAKELYILNAGGRDFINTIDAWTTDVFWIDDNIYKQPDLIIHYNCLFGRWNNTFIISVDDDIQSNFYHLGENHLLMRLFGYIFDDDSNIVLHGAVVANNDFGVLITGLSGAGKSTLSAHCLRMGLQFVSDDRVAIHMENGEIYADPIYTTLSLCEPIDGLKITKTSKPENCTKDIVVLDKSQISSHIKIKAIIEPIKADLNQPGIIKTAPAPVLTRMCSDYSNFSLLTRSMNPLNDYKKIANLFKNTNVYSLHLSKSVEDNARAIYNLMKGDTNV